MNAINKKEHYFEIIDAYCEAGRSYFSGRLCSKKGKKERLFEIRLSYLAMEYSWMGMEEVKCDYLDDSKTEDIWELRTDEKISLEEFKRRVCKMDIASKAELRNEYIRKFVNINHPHYKAYILDTQKYVDGECYTGFLWDCLNEPVRIDEEHLICLLNKFDDFYVMWDIHSFKEIPYDYWQFGKDDVLRLSVNDLLLGLRYLPEDLYIFDEEMTWTLVLTHEDADGRRYYVKGGEI